MSRGLHWRMRMNGKGRRERLLKRKRRLYEGRRKQLGPPLQEGAEIATELPLQDILMMIDIHPQGNARRKIIALLQGTKMITEMNTTVDLPGRVIETQIGLLAHIIEKRRLAVLIGKHTGSSWRRRRRTPGGGLKMKRGVGPRETRRRRGKRRRIRDILRDQVVKRENMRIIKMITKKSMKSRMVVLRSTLLARWKIVRRPCRR